MKKLLSAVAIVALFAASPAMAVDLHATAVAGSNVQATATLQSAAINPVTPATGLAALAGIQTVGSYNSITGAAAIGAATSQTGNFRGAGALTPALLVNQNSVNAGLVAAVGVANSPQINGGYFGSITAAQGVGASAGLTINHN